MKIKFVRGKSRLRTATQNIRPWHATPFLNTVAENFVAAAADPIITIAAMGKQSRAALLATNLPHLQNLIKRDAGSYKEEFLLQWQHYQSSHAIFLLRPDEEDTRFVELAGFIAQVLAPVSPSRFLISRSQTATLTTQKRFLISLLTYSWNNTPVSPPKSEKSSFNVSSSSAKRESSPPQSTSPQPHHTNF
jgi:hypothetical protein